MVDQLGERWQTLLHHLERWGRVLVPAEVGDGPGHVAQERGRGVGLYQPGFVGNILEGVHKLEALEIGMLLSNWTSSHPRRGAMTPLLMTKSLSWVPSPAMLPRAHTA